MSADQWLILLCGLAFLSIPLAMLAVDRRNVRRRRRAIDEHTALWNDEIGARVEGDRQP